MTQQLIHINLPVSRKLDAAIKKSAKLMGMSKSAFIREVAAEASGFGGNPHPFKTTRPMPRGRQ